MKSTAKALATAREVLDGTICLCGDTSSDHYTTEKFGKYGACAVGGCRCMEFKPVKFKVEVEAIA